MKRRLLSLAMVLAIALSLLPTAALATEEENAENNDNLAGMSKQDDTSDTEIPATTAPIPTDETMPEADGTPSAAASFKITEDTTELESGTYTLEKNVTVSGALTVPSGETVTIDLGGYTLTLRGSEQIEDVAYQTKTAYSSLNNNGSLTILNGTVDGSGTYQSDEGTYYANTIANKGNLTIGSDAIINGNAYAICNMGGTVRTNGAIESTFSDAIITYGGEVIVEGGSLTAEATNGGSCITVFNRAYNNSSDGAQVYINGGTLTAYGYVVSGNNLYSGGNNPPLSNVTITGGTLHSTKYSAIYWPISGTLTIGSSNAADTPTITSAGSAVEICSGTLMIHNGKLSSTAPSSEPMNQTLVDGYRTHSGSAGPGDAVTIISRRGDGYVSAPLSVTIDGGTFSSTANYAIRYMDCNLATDAKQLSQDVTFNITGGTFESPVDAEFVQDTDQNFITGGTFSTYPGEYVPAGYTITPEATEAGPYMVKLNPDGGMEVTPPTTSDGSASATMDGVYTGANTEVEGGNSTGTPGEEATGNRNGDVTVNLTTGKNTTSTTLTVTQSAAESLDAANSLTVVTDKGSVSLDNTALGNVADTTSNVCIKVQEETPSDTNVKATYTVSVTDAAGKNLLPYTQKDSNGTVTITVENPEGDDIQAWYVTAQNGQKVYVERLTSNITEADKLAIDIHHLSTIDVLSGDPPADSQAVAMVVDEHGALVGHYATLADAIAQTPTGGTVTLEKGITLSDNLRIEKSITLDLNGQKISMSGTTALIIASNSTVTVLDSSAEKTGAIENSGSGTIAVLANSSLTVKNCSVINTASNGKGFQVQGELKIEEGTEITTTGESGTGVAVYGASANLIVNGGKIHTTGYAIAGNGRNDGTTITINGGEITSTESNVIYHPQEGNLAINGGTITGYSGVQYCGAGKVTIIGGTLRATMGYTEFPAKPASQADGSAFDGAALSIISRGGGYQSEGDKIEVSITGGTFISDNNAAVSVYRLEQVDGNWVTNDSTSVDNYLDSLTITADNGTSPTFISGAKKNPLEIDPEAVDASASNESVVTVSAGSFSQPIEGKYLDDSLNAQLQSASNTRAPYSYYTSVSAAQAAAQAGDVVTELATGESGTSTTYYTIVLNNGSSIYRKDFVQSGGSYTLPAAPSGASNQRFDGWSFHENLYQPGHRFDTISASMTFDAIWTTIATGDDSSGSSSSYDDSEPSYSNTIDASDGGSVKVSPRTPSEGETVTITPDPESGYEVDEVIVTDRSGNSVKVTANRNGTYTFEQPRGRVTIEVTFVRTGGTEGATPFLDVAEDAWYAEAVAYVYENGLMSGTSSTLFSPNATTTRGMIVTMLYRLEGEPAVSFGSSFDDVDASTYYADAVAWASQNGIVTGYDEATFGPNDAITREQMAAILYRYAQYKGYGTTAGGMAIREYEDYESISEYALEAMGWAIGEGLVTGTSSNTLTPDGSAIRAQVATIFMRFMENVVQ